MARFTRKKKDPDPPDTNDLVTELKLKKVMPAVPLRDIVVFPGMVVPLLIGRQKTINAVEEAQSQTKNLLVLVFQTHPETEDPAIKELIPIGTLARIIQVVRQPEGQLKLLVESLLRVRLDKAHPDLRYFAVSVEAAETGRRGNTEEEALQRLLVDSLENYNQLNPVLPREILGNLLQINDPERLSDTLSGYLPLKKEDKARVLQELELVPRLKMLLQILNKEIEVLQVQRQIQGEVIKKIEKNQREYILQEQMKTIQQELGKEAEGSEVKAFQEKIEASGMPEPVRKKALEELERFSKMMSLSPEATVVRNYLDWMVSLPWKKTTSDTLDIRKAQEVLDEDHYGLEKPKERILEYLAVRKRSQSLKGPILCLVGPPGSGKTSLARSVARAMGRQFIRVSLGGVRDEAEIRGHRRTYIGSLPGRVIQSMRKVGVRNPVFLLDEVDKLGMDFRGDPASALLEVLDPEQNCAFNDHYLEVDFDLSQVFFITTANVEATIPPPLLDRMEIITLPGYTETEKLQIARRYLVPREMTANGLKDGEFEFSDEAIREIIRSYTREAGVRSLQRQIASICRKIVKEKELRDRKLSERVKVSRRRVGHYLGVPSYWNEESDRASRVGVVTGLAWTEYGGDVLFTEVSTMKGRGQLIITGRLGEVMKESCRIALSLVRAHDEELGIDPEIYRRQDIHIHVPSGAVPKDGPSAGVTIASALASCFSGRAVAGDIAMTGEITLRGKVMPIGGLRAKLLAASRNQIRRVIIPKDNQRDLAEIPRAELAGLQIIPVENISEIFKIIFNN
ncbi:MAG TPA: endopeptidase La [bacterium]|uniref:Lon protease n=1 Tax=candidate division TA06 bacterium ADurb.Bin417 TaxID=1852828 RepID=A0A1V5MFW2_UNCT6|nr:MAG: Lon protease [candidate division TA06 bacterium ADurb.Bin417]HNQ34564.1 endopeptidase La [bacterium]